MPWKRHRLRDADVWAEVDGDGRLVSDELGRVSVIYQRGAGAKVYRAARANLTPIAGASVETDLMGAGATPPPKDRGKPGPNTVRARSLRLGDPLPPDAIHVWTDGACTGNPGPAGLGVVVIDGATRREHGEYLGRGTNNIAELTAVLRGLDLVTDRARPVVVYTDSSYAIGVLSLGWKAKANVELVAEIRDALARYADVRFVKVPGHAGVAENERCDALARAAVVGGR